MWSYAGWHMRLREGDFVRIKNITAEEFTMINFEKNYNDQRCEK
jgi:hypothetical protein